MARVLLLLPTKSYRTSDFLAAARSLKLDVTVASEEPSALEKSRPDGLLTLDFRDPAACARRAVEYARRYPVAAVQGVDEQTAVAAAAIAAALDLPANPSSAAVAAWHKPTLRRRLKAAGVPTPNHAVFARGEDPEAISRRLRYPCVLKPTFLSGSRGVIRANTPAEFLAAWSRIARLLEQPDVARIGGKLSREILVEDFAPGREFALEGLLREGALSVLALFDKPDPLDGPFFEETIYVTPSRLGASEQERIREVVADGARALGLVEGPVHAEVRHGESGTWLIELAARSIGGLCARTLRFGTGVSLEELILSNALRLPIPSLERERLAAGVMMIPIPRPGVLREVHGLDRARAVPGLVEATISAHPGQTLVPLPEGSRYLGFLFSRAETPERAEAALREAHAALEFRIEG
ncbi:MAG TPA: ATP-grasp domain-containing protein [Thermoanaerobaculia bacterium]|nr:ATP-grasp domain-containing protein [Thermoanaerobaculia bacterium]